jgi:hypothetical protein
VEDLHANPGDAVLYRNVFRGRVRSCFPSHYVGRWDARHGLYCQPGTQCKRSKSAEDVSYAQALLADGPAFDFVWSRTHRLRFVREGDAHTVELFWDEAWGFLGWYVNLQAPLVIRGTCFDTTDLELDVWVRPDGTWEWKDEDGFAEMQELGILDAATAAELRAEGERVIAERPWPTGWEDWRAPAEWAPLELLEDWHVV